MSTSDPSSKDPKELVRMLASLRMEFGRFTFDQAMKAIKRQKLGKAATREARKKFPWSKYRKLYEQQRGICPVCKDVMALLRGKVEIDHRDPTRTDFNADGNLQLTHRRCNRSKSCKTPYELAKAERRTVLESLSHEVNQQPRGGQSSMEAKQ